MYLNIGHRRPQVYIKKSLTILNGRPIITSQRIKAELNGGNDMGVARTVLYKRILAIVMVFWRVYCNFSACKVPSC